MHLLHPLFMGSLLSLLSLGTAYAAPSWLTLVGDPTVSSSDYVQFDPSGISRANEQPTIPVRVSRSHPRTTKSGVVFRSFESVAEVNCSKRKAYYLQASFFASPDFQGESFKTEVYDASDRRPMEFRLIKGKPTQRMINAACNTGAIKSI